MESPTPAYETIALEQNERVLLIRLAREKALNALNTQVQTELVAAIEAADRDPAIGCLVLTGSDRAFAAGADIKEMASQDYGAMLAADWFAGWGRFAQHRKPIVAAVAGYALGGGCELAMMCDIVIAADNAKFGQPEINLGVMPGMGGSQRLTRAIGKAKAMDMILTGRQMDAAEAERSGLVARVVPLAELVPAALEIAALIAAKSLPSVLLAKEAVDRAFEVPLAEGLLFERRVFHSLFATADQKEGMAAFTEKRKPGFVHR